MKYKAIVFDYGGVIYGSSGGAHMAATAELLGIDITVLREAFFRHNHLANVAGHSWQEMWRFILADLDAEEKYGTFIDFDNAWTEENGVQADVVELLKTLRRHSYQIGLLSNYGSGLRGELKKYDLTQHFDVIGVSGEMGCMKPDPEIFHKMCKMLDVEPREMIFIDDSPRSLSTADEVGYTPILFNSCSELIKELEVLGVRVE